MKNAITRILASSKFLVGTLTVSAIVAAVVLRVFDKIPGDALLPTIAGITATGYAFIRATGDEDAALKSAGGKATPVKEPAPSVLPPGD
jgi:hypothetical protein